MLPGCMAQQVKSRVRALAVSWTTLLLVKGVNLSEVQDDASSQDAASGVTASKKKALVNFEDVHRP